MKRDDIAMNREQIDYLIEMLIDCIKKDEQFREEIARYLALYLTDLIDDLED